VLLANGASLGVCHRRRPRQLHHSLQSHPHIVSMEETDIRNYEASGCRRDPMSSSIDVSFISLKAVLPVALSLAAAPMHLLALIKPQFEAERKHSKHGIIKNAFVHQQICDDISAFAASFGAPTSRVSVVHCRRRRQHRILHRGPSWRTERLVIDHVGHRGDGVAAAGGESVYVPYTLGGETVEVAPVPATIPTAEGGRGRQPKPRTGDTVLSRISGCLAAGRNPKH